MAENGVSGSFIRSKTSKNIGLDLKGKTIPARRGEALVTPNLDHEEHVESDPPHAADIPCDEPESFGRV